MTGIAVFAHGSSIESANEAVRAVAFQLAASVDALVEPAFLELGKPDLAGAIERLIERGATRVLVVPYFLTLGIHLQRDLPRIIERIRSIHASVTIEVSEPLDGHPALLQVLEDRVRQMNAGGSSPEGKVG